MKKINLGHQYANRYVTTPYYSINLMNENFESYLQLKKVKTLRLELEPDPNSKDPETDLRKFYEGAVEWMNAVGREKIVFLIGGGFYDAIKIKAEAGEPTELLIRFLEDGSEIISFRGILIDRVRKKTGLKNILRFSPASSDYEKRYLDFELFGADDHNSSMAEWDREFEEYLKKRKDEKTTKGNNELTMG